MEAEADKKAIDGKSLDNARNIVTRWADLEESGHLEKKETSLNADFLFAIFGDALGYTVHNKSPDHYHLEREFHVSNVGQADGALGNFGTGKTSQPLALIELKDAGTNLDVDRFNGRTPVQQCWDYLNASPGCPWGIVSNFSEIRLYHRDHTPARFEVFTLQDLRDVHRFRQFYYLLQRKGLIEGTLGTCPIFRGRRDAELTKTIYRHVPVLVNHTRKQGGNPWGVKFIRMLDQTNDAELFASPVDLLKKRYKPVGNQWQRGQSIYLPLYEAKMVQMYDHRAASVVIEESNWMRQGQTESTTTTQHQNPEYLTTPRYWIEAEHVAKALGDYQAAGYIVYKDVTSPTNQRTMIAAFAPHVGFVNSAPLILTDPKLGLRKTACLLANLNSFAMDYTARQKVGNVHLNFFIVEQLPVFAPDRYDDQCPWDESVTLEQWISERVLKLTCTADDMIPLAKAAGFKPPVHKWKEQERAQLMAELDAAFFVLYGIRRPDVEYILTTFQGVKKTHDLLPGTPSTADLILTAYDAIAPNLWRG